MPASASGRKLGARRPGGFSGEPQRSAPGWRLAGFGYLVGYAAGFGRLRELSSDQQAWAVFAFGLIAAIVLLFRASRTDPPAGTSRPPETG